MSTNDESGPAFPVFAEQYHYGIGEKVMHTKEQGMTLRDYFAAKVMQGLIAASGDNDGVVTYTDENVAESAYLMADAMLKARSA